MITKNKRLTISVVSILWFIGLLFLGWKAILWTCIGMAIGGIIKTLKENV